MHTFITLIAIAILSRSNIAAPVSGPPVEISTGGSGGFKLQITLDISENERQDTADQALDNTIFNKFDDKYDHNIDG
ncbi:hypothetical protein GMOD_00002632 [Pyrenophora seminiperda CCB06]|uniref:Uncharacterized protein n=1 Tax=Pyrenophora seminiperda CCB06 TaxID=1302712 RepID=A0A3M7M314_9PLEO|nr:hypothetical protein GMOD_00002632 [Pyrenophora seminiperda CCB06]